MSNGCRGEDRGAEIRARRTGAAVLPIAIAMLHLAGPGCADEPEPESETTAAQGEGGAAWDEDWIETMADYFHFSREQAIERLGLEDAAAEFSGEELLGDRYAGEWLDASGAARLFVAIEAPAQEGDQAVVEQFPYPVELVYVEFSLAELEAAQEIMIRDRSITQRALASAEELDARGLDPLTRSESLRLAELPAALTALEGIYNLGIDVETNRLEVSFRAHDSRLEEVVRTFYTADTAGASPEIAFREGIGEPGCSRGDCRWRARGGLRIEATIPAGPYCTSGFAARTDGPTKPVMFTAGHCNNSAQRNGGELILGSDASSYFAQQVRGDVDAQIARIDSDWHASSNILIHNSGDLRSISSKVSWSQTDRNVLVGKSGAATGTTRGLITRRFESPYWVADSFHFIRAEAGSFRGDSGAPVFRNNTAYGIVSGVGPTSIIFGNIRSAEIALDATIY
jgi:hypothetical protein